MFTFVFLHAFLQSLSCLGFLLNNWICLACCCDGLCFMLLAQSHYSCFIPLHPPMLCSVLPKCLTQWGSVYDKGLHRLVQIMTNGLFLFSVKSLWIVGWVDLCCTLFPARLHGYLVSCKNLLHLLFTLLKSISFFFFKPLQRFCFCWTHCH